MWAAVWLSLGPAVSNGFARFAYALILPAMHSDLSWSYTQAGSMNSVNALGYLAGSLLAFYAIAAVGARRLFISGMYVTAAALVLSGFTADFDTLAALRFAALWLWPAATRAKMRTARLATTRSRSASTPA